MLGVVAAFQELGETSGTSMGSVMGGIAEALIATALGIGVALPAVVAYNLFTKRAYETEDNARALMSLILAHRKSIRYGTRPSVPAAASQPYVSSRRKRKLFQSVMMIRPCGSSVTFCGQMRYVSRPFKPTAPR